MLNRLIFVKVTYRERLLPKWWVFVFVGSLIAMLSVAYGAAISVPVGWVMFIALAALVGVGMFTSSPVIEVSEVLRVDDARLPVDVVSSVVVLDSVQTRTARSGRTGATNFVLVKTWAAADAVLVTLDDPSDPHPAWLVSTRHPQALMDAITEGAQATGSATG